MQAEPIYLLNYQLLGCTDVDFDSTRGGSDCARIWFRRQNRDKRQALCNWSNADMQSATIKQYQKFALDGKKLMR